MQPKNIDQIIKQTMYDIKYQIRALEDIYNTLAVELEIRKRMTVDENEEEEYRIECSG